MGAGEISAGAEGAAETGRDVDEDSTWVTGVPDAESAGAAGSDEPRSAVGWSR